MPQDQRPERPTLRALRGSERRPLTNARAVAPADADQPIELTIYVRPRQTNERVPTLHEVGHRPYEWLDKTAHASEQDREAMLKAFEADPKDLQKVEQYARANNLKVIESSAAKRSVLVKGRTGDAARAFGVDLQIWEHPGGRYRGRTGPVHVPPQLDGVVEAVLGFDNRPVGRPLLHRNDIMAVSRAGRRSAFLPTELAQIYNFPDDTDGTGETVVILAFNGALGDGGQAALGGYKLSLLNDYFGKLKFQTPNITDVVIHGPGNQPGPGTDPTDATGEVLLDICMAGAIAPKAKFLMYFTEFTEQGWVDAITSAVTATPRPSVISISYGNPEDGPAREILWTKQAILKVNEAFQRAALANITVCCASGDAGSADEVDDRLQHVDFPASSPWVTGCGGTRLVAAQGAIVHETVWNDGPTSAGGGGISRLFALPSYQAGASVPPSVDPGHRIGRGVPDVAAVADPETGVLVVFPDGSVDAIGGTSAAAPLWSGLVARLNQALRKPVGFLNPYLYKMTPGVLHDITEGDNGAYRAGPGWDACTGLGTPEGTRLLTALQSLVA